ncbi:MAG: metal ABC transporter substrate-binding protein [Prevotella sp.]|nr:metal ABC transporter substrate-binding protein [Alistipes senegalensis]MCM1358511.1 metal ABC transporter substrate-binding protein [Prevotella sp.]
MKKFLSIICCLAVSGLVGCSSATAEKSDKINIVCTVFPEYDWVREITGNTDNIEITYLLGNGSDMHSYQPSMDDIIKISSCDLFVYTGGESDKWAEDTVNQAKNKNIIALSMLESLGSSAKTEEIKEGMQSDETEESAEYDEHIWLSLDNAGTLCTAIADTLCQVDPENSEQYQENLSTYCHELERLDNEYSETLSGIENKTLIFGDRFPFRYLVDDYGLDYFAAFSGCSAETEASFETITFLADKVDELNIDTIFTIEGSDDSIAKAIISGTTAKNQKISRLDSIQSVTSRQIADGVTYLSIMQSNLNTLKEVLS